ncbi:MAG: zf-TFIIB domain-containing protein [Candidatus Omnitrophica bacterium]|nr:zf-TFIIB domain-containing protein [Candidatus Omnitrophota bacterium]
MQCPVCQKNVLKNQELDKGLMAKHCPQCEGSWLSSFQYWRWLEKHAERLPEKDVDEGLMVPVEESTAGKLCPECGCFLIGHKVGHGIVFQLDHCATCGGIWFDKNEWEILRSRNLHDELHLVFSAAWQNARKKQEQKETYEKRIQSILGEPDYQHVVEFHSWLKNHPHKSSIMSYLKEVW